jgi:hypothetical protein
MPPIPAAHHATGSATTSPTIDPAIGAMTRERRTRPNSGVVVTARLDKPQNE